MKRRLIGSFVGFALSALFNVSHADDPAVYPLYNENMYAMLVQQYDPEIEKIVQPIWWYENAADKAEAVFYELPKINYKYSSYVHYPGSTLFTQVGDCKDMAVLYSSCLKSAGVSTALAIVPGHMFMMFENDNDNKWVPVETTLLDTTFDYAVERARELCNVYNPVIKIVINDLEKLEK